MSRWTLRLLILGNFVLLLAVAGLGWTVFQFMRRPPPTESSDHPAADGRAILYHYVDKTTGMRRQGVLPDDGAAFDEFLRNARLDPAIEHKLRLRYQSRRDQEAELAQRFTAAGRWSDSDFSILRQEFWGDVLASLPDQRANAPTLGLGGTTTGGAQPLAPFPIPGSTTTGTLGTAATSGTAYGGSGSAGGIPTTTFGGGAATGLPATTTAGGAH